MRLVADLSIGWDDTLLRLAAAGLGSRWKGFCSQKMIGLELVPLVHQIPNRKISLI